MSKLTQLARSATNTVIELMLIYVLVILGCSALFAGFEGASFWDSVWWSVTTATTTGYGDIAPKTVGGRIVAMALMHLSVFIIIPLVVARIITNFIENRDAFTHHEQEEMLARLARIEARLNQA
jgi:voltage-gated potassium channel